MHSAAERRVGHLARHTRVRCAGLRFAAAALCSLVVLGALAPTLAHGEALAAADGATTLTALASVESSTTSPTPDATPTATFAGNASWGVRLNRPAQPADMLGIGFHQADRSKRTLKMTPAGACLRVYNPKRTRRLLAPMQGIGLFQQALRGRGTSNFSAADCAVKPKSVILAPVSGTVTCVKNYRLYGVYRDVQLEILPEGASPKLRVVVLHIQDPQVKVGDRVLGGVTPIATVRHFRFESAVNRYLPVKYADHTHVQINRK